MRAKEINRHRYCERAPHDERDAQAIAQAHHCAIELVTPVNAIKHDIAVTCPCHDLLPVFQGISLKAFEFGMAYIVESCVFERSGHFALAHILQSIHKLPIQIVNINNVVVNQIHLGDTKTKHIEEDARAYSAYSEYQYPLRRQFLLLPEIYSRLPVEGRP